ncbi:MAG: SH3 domain-containing protein [Lentilitoribacter sp.]
MKMLTKTSLLSALLIGSFAASHAQPLDVDVMERADDGLDTCAYGQIVGLKSDGDGFLSVRTGPGIKYESFDELKNNDKVWLFEEKDGWYGIVYDLDELNCSPVENDRPVETDGKKGWVFGKWVEVFAG